MDILQEYRQDDFYVRHAVECYPDDKNFTMHIHEQCEIFFFILGRAEYLVEGSKYPLEHGSLLIMRPAESHRTRIIDSRRYERYAVNFAPAILNSIDPQGRMLIPFDDRPLGRGNLYYPSEIDSISLEELFREMCYCDGDDYGRRLKILTHLFTILDRINKAYIKRGAAEYTPPQSLGEKMVTYVNVHLFDELSVPLLADRFFLSTSQFSRIFKQATGAAPWEYITIKRLTAAKEKIRSGISAQSAGNSCGFGDYSAFYRAYTKYFGCAPKDTI